MSHAIFVRILRTPLAVLLAAMLSLTAASCGGAGGGPGPFGAGQGLVLLNFSLDSVDNVALNTVVEMEFSEPVDGDTINAAAVQIREGPAFGQDVPGEFRIVGSTVLWEPRLPSLCDNSDSALKPDTTYRVQLIGFPEEFSIRNTQGQPLDTTQTYEFQTRADTDPDKFIDQLPGTPPVVTGASPANGSEAVKVEGGNKVVLTVSENIDPCTVNDMTVFFHIYQFGDIATSVAANGGTANPSGLDPSGLSIRVKASFSTGALIASLGDG